MSLPLITIQSQRFSSSRYLRNIFFLNGSIVYSHSSQSEKNWKIRLKTANTKLSPCPKRNGKRETVQGDCTILSFQMVLSVPHREIAFPALPAERYWGTAHSLVLPSKWSRSTPWPSRPRPPTSARRADHSQSFSVIHGYFSPTGSFIPHYDLLPNPDKILSSSSIKSHIHLDQMKTNYIFSTQSF